MPVGCGAVASITIRPAPPRARASWYATKSSVGRWFSTSVVWCAVETIRFCSSTGPSRSGLKRLCRLLGGLDGTFERLPLGRGERSRPAGFVVPTDQNGFGLGRQLTGHRANLLAEREARVPDPDEPARDDDHVV